MVLLPLMEEHGYHIYRNHVKFDEHGRRYIQKGKIQIRISPSMVRRWRMRTSSIREKPIMNRAVTSKADHDMKVENFILLWKS